MDSRTATFYLALFLIAVSVAELYVRLNGIGEKVQKVDGDIVPKKARLGPPTLSLIAAIVAAVMTIPQ